MSNDYVVEQPSATAVAYIAVPYGTTGGGLIGEKITGVSSFADSELAHAATGIKRALLITEVAVEQALGVLRWGFNENFSGQSFFIEKGREILRSKAVIVDYSDLPDGKQLSVRVAWYYPNLSWTVIFQ